MRNIDKIKSMSIDEMAELLYVANFAYCETCKYCEIQPPECHEEACRNALKQWLESEEE